MNVWFRYAVPAVALTSLIAAMGVGVGGTTDAGAVLAGAGFGLAVQLLVFAVLAIWLFPGNRFLAFGLGLLGRIAALGVAAFVLAPLAGFSLPYMLFTLVAVFFATTLLEPVVIHQNTLKLS